MYHRRKTGTQLVVSLLLFCSFHSLANMIVYPMSVYMKDNGEGSVRVISKSNDVQYVRTKVFKIENPATPQEKEVEVSSKDGSGLIVMPPMFAVPGGASKLVRMVSMEPVAKEVMYRVMFESVPSLDDTAPAKDKSIGTQLSVNLVWGILVSVPPATPVVDLTLSTNKQQILNHGTQRVKIIDLAMCRKGQTGSACKHKTDNRNIFPGGTYALPAESGVQTVEVKYKNWITNKTAVQTFSVN